MQLLSIDTIPWHDNGVFIHLSNHCRRGAHRRSTYPCPSVSWDVQPYVRIPHWQSVIASSLLSHNHPRFCEQETDALGTGPWIHLCQTCIPLQ